MVKIAVCDDEETILNQTKQCLEKYKKVPITIELFSSGEDLIRSEHSYEIIILDIDMKGINGIETAKAIREKDKKVKIIYLTNYTDYTIFAFAVHAFAYLLKPIDQMALYKQLDDVFSYQMEEEEEKLEFITQDGVVRLRTKEILYFEYQQRMVYITAQNGTFRWKKKITDTLKEMESYNFAMPHKSFVVNLYHVKAIRGYTVEMTDGTSIPLSQKKSPEFRKKLNCYLSAILHSRLE